MSDLSFSLKLEQREASNIRDMGAKKKSVGRKDIRKEIPAIKNCRVDLRSLSTMDITSAGLICAVDIEKLREQSTSAEVERSMSTSTRQREAGVASIFVTHDASLNIMHRVRTDVSAVMETIVLELETESHNYMEILRNMFMFLNQTIKFHDKLAIFMAIEEEL